MCLKSDDERYIRSMIENPISIVLLGNRPSVKARIANYILGYELLPVSFCLKNLFCFAQLLVACWLTLFTCFLLFYSHVGF